MGYRYPPETGDPSEVVQDFQKIGINIQCCRYWWVGQWKHKRLSYPFWRLYYNFNEGARVFYKKQVALSPERLLLIPPFTPFSTDLEGDGENDDYGLEGGWIKSDKMEQEALQKGYVLHLFIHFNLGYPHDTLQPGIYKVDATEEDKMLFGMIAGKLKTGSASFSMADTLMLHQLITSSMVRIPEELWDTKTPEERVQQAIHYMNRNIDKSITNETLADVVGMAVNSFGRLFKEQTGLSPQHYLTRIRIENACNLLYHTNHNIDSIAEESGFSDRYYFSRVFKNQMNISPVRYRKQFQMM